MLKKYSCIVVVMATLFGTGCASYRTNSDIQFDSTELGDREPSIPVGNIDLKGKKVEELGTVEAVIKKLTLFHASPTRKQADIVLAQKAKEKDADAVINVSYDSGVGFDTWEQLRAKGTAIKIEE